jgi:hypothetical protein
MEKIRFLHIPKCAGSYIKKVFRNEPRFKELSTNPNRALEQIDNSLTTFTVIRNPYDLLVTYYTSKHQESPHRGKLSYLNNYIGPFCHVNTTGESFKDFVNNFLDSEYTPASYQYYQNRSLFFQLYDYADRIKVPEILLLEHLDVQLRNFAETYNVTLTPIEHSKTTRLGQDIPEEDLRYNVSRIKEDRDFTKFYDEDLREKVYNRFRSDFENFGYEFKSTRDLN